MNIAKKTKIYAVALGLLVAVVLVAGGCGDRARRCPPTIKLLRIQSMG